jgi:hypothetical protein
MPASSAAWITAFMLFGSGTPDLKPLHGCRAEVFGGRTQSMAD